MAYADFIIQAILTHTHTHNVPRGNVEGFINKGITDTVQKWGGRCAGHREVVRVSRPVQTTTFFTFPFSARRTISREKS